MSAELPHMRRRGAKIHINCMTRSALVEVIEFFGTLKENVRNDKNNLRIRWEESARTQRTAVASGMIIITASTMGALFKARSAILKKCTLLARPGQPPPTVEKMVMVANEQHWVAE